MGKTIQLIEATPVMPRQIRVAAYARVSCDKDSMEQSLMAQVEYYSQMIQSNGEWEYIGVYADFDKTGTKENRPEFQRMLRDCRAGRIDLLLVKSISRLARNTVTQLNTIRELKALGTDIFFETENIHTMNAAGELLITLLASFAQEESRSASENVKWRIRNGFKNGELQCLHTMFGYDIDKDSITVNERDAAIVREVFSRFLREESLTEIAKDLNRREVEGILGGAWTHNRIRRLLANEKYTGNAILQKTFVNNHLEKKCIKNPGDVVPRWYATETHPAIVDQETFDRAQQRLAMLAEMKKNERKPQTCEFSGIIRCAHCGNTYRHMTNNGTTGWRCTTYQQKGRAFCRSKKIPDDKLRDAAASAMRLREYDSKVFRQMIEFIEVPADNVLVFHFFDGHMEEQTWIDHSRRDSWTPEMKEKARMASKARADAKKRSAATDSGQLYKIN